MRLTGEATLEGMVRERSLWGWEDEMRQPSKELGVKAGGTVDIELQWWEADSKRWCIKSTHRTSHTSASPFPYPLPPTYTLVVTLLCRQTLDWTCGNSCSEFQRQEI